MEVNRLCEIDGGLRVYEQVKLPPDQYAKYIKGTKEQSKAPDAAFYSVISTKYLKGPPGGGDAEPVMWASSREILRASDKKVLGAYTTYSRRGGDISFGAHPSSYGCPSLERLAQLNKQGGIEGAVFAKEGDHDAK
jgi:hypothetical protein